MTKLQKIFLLSFVLISLILSVLITLERLLNIISKVIRLAAKVIEFNFFVALLMSFWD